jgi:hypothetical protein
MTLPQEHFPFQLGATDIVKHILNIDSRFRENPTLSTSSNYYFRLLTPVRNVLRIRITSIELPNNYYIFTAKRRNITIEVKYGIGFATTKTIVIPEGNYSAFDLESTLDTLFAADGMSWLTNLFDEINGTYTFTGTQPFQINTNIAGNGTYDRPFDYGLGYNIGFSRGIYTAELVGGKYLLTSNQCATFAGDQYLFLKINDFNCVRQTVSGNDFCALAKIVVKEPKSTMSFDDYAGQHAKEVTFPAPYDLSRFNIQLLDPYGIPIDLNATHFSFSIEVLEVRNLSLYNMIRDSFATKWTL